MDRSSWCTVDIDGNEIGARIVHKGKGKFRIEDDADGSYEGTVVDASDVISCNVDRMPADQNDSA